ncbi:hypothetical protein A2311_04835 [candidate division WOR-1 bacterium RIFOXYB2_FULL_48_7]|uniref:histidine kinase n=1 Tax=candidate division WOR-1 bacterium RIFOXYB2_FULL_48_7 TaxID=1802583 RepID=A0A1F4TWH5_UNCSA|nr:MAG: hypothetical protein A2311_04835 [candidate division WOR-1 bacterium RIFOXYB2_FULL_48_7]
MKSKKSIFRSIIYIGVVIAALGTIVSVGNNYLGYLLPLYTVIANMVLGSIIFLQNPNSNINRAFSFIVLCIVVWTLVIFMYWEATGPVFAHWCSNIAYVSTSFIPAVFVYFTLIFPDRGKKISNLTAFVLIAPVVTNVFLALTGNIIQGTALGVSGYDLVPGKYYFVFTIYFVVYMSWAFANLLRTAFSKEGKGSTQSWYVFLAFLLGSIFPIITNLILPMMNITILTRFGPSFTILLVGISAYAITKHNLMDISVIVSRTVAELIAIVFNATLYGIIVWLYRGYISTMIDTPFLLITLSFGLFVGQTHHSLRIFFQTSADKLILHGKYDYYKTIADVTTSIGEKIALKDILSILYQTFIETMEIANPRIYLPENFSELVSVSTRYVAYDKKSLAPYLSGDCPEPDSRLIDEILKTKNIISDVPELDAAIIVPCFVEGRLIAFFALGPKLSEDIYTDEDLKLLKTLANQVAISLDHTRSYEKIRAELDRAEKAAEHAQYLASLGTLTAGVAHEIRNPLTVVRSQVEGIADKARDIEYLKEFRQQALAQIDRITGIIERMLTLSQDKAGQAVEVNINPLIDSVLPALNPVNTTVIRELQAVPNIKGDPEEIRKMLVNLCQNALEAMREQPSGKLTIKTFPDGGRVVIEITDTGKGVPKELKGKIFDPFFSTRHEGAGLGLPIVYRIVREHGGEVSVHSDGVEKGSTFKVVLPAVAS